MTLRGVRAGLCAVAVACAVAARAGSDPALRYVGNSAYGLGETLSFDVSYGFITAGQATMAIDREITNVNGRPCLHMRFDVSSKPSFDWLYRVRDHYDTFVDVDGIFPWRFEQHIREGGYTHDFEARFDQTKHVASTSDGQTFPIPPFVHDILSAYYFVRTLDLHALHKDDIVHLQNFYKDKTYELDVRVLGRQDISVTAGKFHCVVIEPLVREGGLFKSEGRIVIWLTDDARKIPVKVSTKIIIGSIDAELTAYSGTRGPIEARVP